MTDNFEEFTLSVHCGGIIAMTDTKPGTIIAENVSEFEIREFLDESLCNVGETSDCVFLWCGLTQSLYSYCRISHTITYIGECLDISTAHNVMLSIVFSLYDMYETHQSVNFLKNLNPIQREKLGS